MKNWIFAILAVLVVALGAWLVIGQGTPIVKTKTITLTVMAQEGTFTIFAPDALQVKAGEEVGFTISVTPQLGFSKPVKFTLAGGPAYALSYHPQKIVESMAGGSKPDLIGIGHYHKAEWIPAYRNVCAIQTGTFESQTPFMVQRSIAAHVGGWIVEVTLGERRKLTSRIRAEFVGFYEPENERRG